MRRYQRCIVTDKPEWDGKVFTKHPQIPPGSETCVEQLAQGIKKHKIKETGKPHYIAHIDFVERNISDDINDAKSTELTLALILEVLLNENRYSHELTGEEVDGIKRRLRGVIATLKEQE